jgi:hypothetical protein
MFQTKYRAIDIITSFQILQADIQRSKLAEQIGSDVIKTIERRQNLRDLGYDNDMINDMIQEMGKIRMHKTHATRGKQNFRGRAKAPTN